MAFVPGSIANKKATTTRSGGFQPGSIANKRQTSTTTATKRFTPGSISGPRRTTSGDTKTSQGLYNMAVQAGLKSKADAIRAQQSGEETKKIFSGGFISDVFDTLSALQYGVTGVIKGKSFMEGIKTRQSFSDKDSLGASGLPGVIAGIALDIAVDPLTYIAPYTLVKKVPALQKLLKGGQEMAFGRRVTKAIEGAEGTYEALEGGTKVGRYLSQKLTYMMGADPVFKESWERAVKNTAVGTQNVVKLGKSVANLMPDTAKKILSKDATGRFIRTPLAQLTLNADEIKPVTELYKIIDDLGKEAVDLKILTKEKYEENFGEYIKNAYTEYELSKKTSVFGSVKAGIKGIKKRVEGLSPERMQELGQIDNPAYLLMKSAADLTRDVENAKLFKGVAERFGTDVAQDGFTKLPTGPRLGMLSGKFVPNHMADYLTEIIAPSQKTLAKTAVANFKFFKVVMNPGTHARNIISNKILNYWKLGMNPLDPRVIKAELEATTEIFKKGGKWTDEARPLGYDLNTFASAEMRNLLDSTEASAWGKTQSGWKQMKEKLGNIYQGEENQAKLTAYIFNRKHKNLSPEEAWKAAESATFNYAQVTPFVRKLRESLFGFPFITFTVKATPAALETIYKNPNRVSVIGKIKTGIENLSDLAETDRERAAEPPWVKNGFYIKLPIKDAQGRSSYFDLTYILPFGDLMSGNFLEGGVDMNTGLPESKTKTALKKSPFIQTVMELGKNQDFYGNSIWKNSDSTEKQLGDLMRHLTKTYMPPPVADQLPGGYDDKGERVNRGIKGALEASDENQKRNLMQELLRNVGAKIQPIDADIQETYQEWNLKKGYQSLLRENGQLDSFEITTPTKAKP